MKLVLTESQVKTIQENLQHRKMFQKYWERFGPGVDENFLNLFGFKRGNLDGTNINNVYAHLREFLGYENAMKMTEELILKNPHKIGDGGMVCGGYDFKFELSINDIEDVNIYVDVLVDAEDPNAEVNIVTGETFQLQKAIDDEEIGYEIESEIEDCVRDYLEQITNKTGVNVTIFSSLYK